MVRGPSNIVDRDLNIVRVVDARMELDFSSIVLSAGLNRSGFWHINAFSPKRKIVVLLLLLITSWIQQFQGVTIRGDRNSSILRKKISIVLDPLHLHLSN